MKARKWTTTLLLLLISQTTAAALLSGAIPKIRTTSEDFLTRLLLESRPTNIWQSLKEIPTALELAKQVRSSHLPLIDREFTQSLTHDLFSDYEHGKSAFSPYAPASIAQIVEILHKGILSFQRAETTSRTFPWKEGYDVVGYRIIQQDESISYVLAYRQEKESPLSRDGHRDLRPRINLVLVAQKNFSLVRSVRVNGRQEVEKKLVPREQAEEQVVHLLNF